MKYEIKVILAILWAFFAIIASAGAFNYGGAIYVIAGLINLGLAGYGVYNFVKRKEE